MERYKQNFNLSDNLTEEEKDKLDFECKEFQNFAAKAIPMLKELAKEITTFC